MIKANRNRYKVEVWDVIQFIFSSFNDHQLHCIIDFKNHIDEECLKKAVDMSVEGLPLIKCRYVEGWFRSYWEECDYTVEDIVKIIKSSNIQEDVSKLITFRPDEFKGPQLRVYIIRGKDSDSICIILNHMISDGVGMKEYVYNLSSIYSNLINNKNYKVDITRIGSRSSKQVLNQFNFKDKINMLSSSAKLSKYNSGKYFKLEGDKSNPFIIFHNIPRDRFLEIKKFSKKTNSTVNDVLMATYIRVIDKFLNCGPVPLPCPVNLRRYLPDGKGEAICNLTSNFVCDIGTDIGDNFNETLAKVKQVLGEEKDSLSCLKPILLLEILFKILPYKMAKSTVIKLFNNPPIAMTNIGLIDKDRLKFEEAEIKSVHINGSIKYKPYFQVAVTTFNDEMTLSVNFHGTENDKVQIRRFLEAFEEELSNIK